MAEEQYREAWKTMGVTIWIPDISLYNLFSPRNHCITVTPCFESHRMFPSAILALALALALAACMLPSPLPRLSRLTRTTTLSALRWWIGLFFCALLGTFAAPYHARGDSQMAASNPSTTRDMVLWLTSRLSSVSRRSPKVKTSSRPTSSLLSELLPT